MREDIYYTAKIGEMWVNRVYKTIGLVNLRDNKKFAAHIGLDDAEWLKKQTGAILIEVKVVVTEIELH